MPGEGLFHDLLDDIDKHVVMSDIKGWIGGDPADTENLILMDAFLPGVRGLGSGP